MKKAAIPSREQMLDFTGRCIQMDRSIDPDEWEVNQSLWSELWTEANEYDQQIKEAEQIVQSGDKQGVWSGFLNDWLVPPVFDRIVESVNHGLNYIVLQNDKYGVVETAGQGKLVLPCIYEHIMPAAFVFDSVFIVKNDRWGVANLYDGDSARVCVEPLYDAILEPEGGFMALYLDTKVGLYRNGHIWAPKYDTVEIPSVAGWIRVNKDGEWGFIDKDGEFTTDLKKAFLYH